jgi:hypothetical protein
MFAEVTAVSFVDMHQIHGSPANDFMCYKELIVFRQGAWDPITVRKRELMIVYLADSDTKDVAV